MARRIETSIEIDGDPETVWAVLVDFGRYPEWNPFIRRVEGKPASGEQLRVEVQPDGGRAMTFRPRVVECRPGQVFAWKGSLGIRGLFDGEHRFELTPRAPGRTRLLHMEQFTGLLVPILWGALEGSTRRGFEAMNAAIKGRVEART